MTLEQIGIASGAFVVGFTLWAAARHQRIGVSRGQSFMDSLLESWANILIGFGINFFANLYILDLANLPVTNWKAFWIGVIFTAISIARSFVLRRLFNWKMLRAVR